MCILTLKSACIFACSAHITDGLFLLWSFVFDIIHVNKLWWYTPGAAYDDDPYLTWYFVLIGIYISLAILLGFFILRGIDYEAARLIFGGGLSFLVLQIVAFIVALCWWYPIPPNYDPFGLLESSRIGRFVIRCLGTIAYVILLIMFGREVHLEDKTVFRRTPNGHII